MSSKNQTFVKGAMILAFANLLVKAIGALFKIPLNNLIGDHGMGYFGSAYTVYNWMFIIATAGIPVAISKMVAEREARGKYAEADKIFFVSRKLLLTIGILGFLFLFFFSDWCANIMQNPNASLGIKALAPGILFVSIMSVYRGYFQGQKNMLPTAISEVCEALGKLIVGFGIAIILIKYGVEYAAAGAVFGVSAGTVIGAIVLMFMYVSKRKKRHYHNFDNTKSSIILLKELVKIALPITIGASVFSLTALIDAAMIMGRLQNGAGFAYDAANALWGAYSGKSQTLFNLIPSIITAISISIVPVISVAFSTKNYKQACDTTQSSMKITILLTAPCAAGMSMLAGPIFQLLFKNANNSETLSILAFAIVFVSLVSLTNAILQSMGHTVIPVIHMIIGGIIKVAVNYYLVGTESINIMGAPVGTIFCYAVILILNLISIKKIINIKYNMVSLVLKPGISVVLMAAVVLTVYTATKSLSTVLTVISCIAAGGVSYLAVLFAVGGVTSEDLLLLPKGDKIEKILKKYKLIKK